MRAVVAVVALLSASVAGAQIGVLAIGGGVTWEVQPEAAPDRDWWRGDEASVSVVLGALLSGDTLVRLQARDLSRTTLVGGAPWRGRVRAYTIGADYFLAGTFGQTSFSGGVGAYRLDLEGERAPSGVESQEFGWYVGVGEWFRLSSRSRLVGEVVLDRTGHPGTPTLLSATVMLALQF